MVNVFRTIRVSDSNACIQVVDRLITLILVEGNTGGLLQQGVTIWYYTGGWKEFCGGMSTVSKTPPKFSFPQSGAYTGCRLNQYYRSYHLPASAIPLPLLDVHV